MENNLYRQGSSGWTSMRRIEEFEEEDIWGSSSSVFGENKVSDSDCWSRPMNMMRKTSSVMTRRLPSATRMIPRSRTSSNSQESAGIMTQHSSAPLNIPDWSKIYGTKSKKSSCLWLDDAGSDDDDDDHGFVRSSWESEDEEEHGEVDDEVIVPPHEWIARKTVTSSLSVCEGAGRTLKGRDLSRVRNAVLTKTGFLES